MHCTLHLTTSCCMRCDYCYAASDNGMDMSTDTAARAAAFASALSKGLSTGIIFFGGEPLLKNDVIRSAVQACAAIKRLNGAQFHFKVTTNGLLLDSDFLEFAQTAGVSVALSVDGARQAHDTHRKTASGAGTFDIVEKKIGLLLNYQPYASALMVVSPYTVSHYTESVDYLLKRGFRYIIASLNYAGAWTDKSLRELRKQYVMLAGLYEKLTLEQKKFYLSPFEMKIASHIGGDAKCIRCALAQRQISVAPDGTLYPCVQFVKDGVSNRAYAIGSLTTGIDEEKRGQLYQKSQALPAACRKCALNARCHNTCSCLNWQTTGSISDVSPVLCEHERMLIPIADRLAERLYAKRAPAFIQKHYNAAYPLLSLMEDVGYAA